MDILLIFPGFILACLVVLLYEYKINLLRKQKNNVHFYVARDKDETLWLYIGKPIREDESFQPRSNFFEDFGLNRNDYKDLKWEDEPIEVFLNLEN